MKRIILQAIICIFLIGCTTGCPDTIIVYYMHGFVDTSNTIPCSESRKAALSDEHSEMMEYDSIIIDHKDFVKIKNYMQNMRYVPRGMKTGISGVDSLREEINCSFEYLTNPEKQALRNGSSIYS